MSLKQISVFVENKPGKLHQLTEVLAKHNVDMRALSLAETTDFGIVRIIVNDVYAASTLLKDEGYIHNVSKVLGVPICKNLFLCNRQKTQFYLLAMAPDMPFHTKDLSHQIGSSRLSFAPEEYLWELLHCTPGSATVLGLMNDAEHKVRFLMEKGVYESEYLSCHPCLCSSTLKLKTADILTKFLPSTGHDVTVVDLTSTEEA